jgi:hypothetical protein
MQRLVVECWNLIGGPRYKWMLYHRHALAGHLKLPYHPSVQNHWLSRLRRNLAQVSALRAAFLAG